MIDQDYVCGDYGTETEWTQIKVTVKLERLDDLVAAVAHVVAMVPFKEMISEPLFT